MGQQITQKYAKSVDIIVSKYSDKYLADISLVFVATNDEKLIANIMAAAQKQNIICNFVDMPEISHFITPAVVKRGDVMVAISTSGKAPVLARNLRLKINQLLLHNLDELVEFHYNFRPIAKRVMTKSKQLFGFWNEVFTQQNIDIFLAKNATQKQEYLLGIIGEQTTSTGKLIEIKLTSRHAEDLTLKAHRLINIADVIIYGNDMQDILGYARRDAKCIHLINELNVETLIQPHLDNGEFVVYLKPINVNFLANQNDIISMQCG
ncbi:MAG: siroheme synthase [Rhizobiales bacterium]|nr:siroheme synthase [Hyphomicrobiales bacterium]NRB15866.1 siroheme synthase [Hyphomicrobiales bacterium]